MPSADPQPGWRVVGYERAPREGRTRALRRARVPLSLVRERPAFGPSYVRERSTASAPSCDAVASAARLAATSCTSTTVNSWRSSGSRTSHRFAARPRLVQRDQGHELERLAEATAADLAPS